MSMRGWGGRCHTKKAENGPGSTSILREASALTSTPASPSPSPPEASVTLHIILILSVGRYNRLCLKTIEIFVSVLNNENVMKAEPSLDRIRPRTSVVTSRCMHVLPRRRLLRSLISGDKRKETDTDTQIALARLPQQHAAGRRGCD